jgi:hypothetical protein
MIERLRSHLRGEHCRGRDGEDCGGGRHTGLRKNLGGQAVGADQVPPWGFDWSLRFEQDSAEEDQRLDSYLVPLKSGAQLVNVGDGSCG